MFQVVSELLSRHVLLNYDKFVEGITEIDLVEDDLQVEQKITLSAHKFAMSSLTCVPTLLQQQLISALACLCVGCLFWYQSSPRAAGLGENRRSDQHQGCKTDQAQACIRAATGGAAQATANLQLAHRSQVSLSVVLTSLPETQHSTLLVFAQTSPTSTTTQPPQEESSNPIGFGRKCL